MNVGISLTNWKLRLQNQGGCKKEFNTNKDRNQDRASPILLHQGTLSTMLQINTVRVEVAFRRDDHHMWHRTKHEDE